MLVIQCPPNRVSQEKIYRELERAVRQVDPCRSWPRNRQEDVIHEAWIRVIRNIERQGKPRQLNRAFFKKVAFSVVIEGLRKEMREAPDDDQVDRRLETGEVPFLSMAVPDPHTQLAAKEDWIGFQECMNELCETQRHAVQLVDVLGHSIGEAATILGWSYLKTDRCLYNGRKNLKKCFRYKGRMKP